MLPACLHTAFASPYIIYYILYIMHAPLPHDFPQRRTGGYEWELKAELEAQYGGSDVQVSIAVGRAAYKWQRKAGLVTKNEEPYEVTTTLSIPQEVYELVQPTRIKEVAPTLFQSGLQTGAVRIAFLKMASSMQVCILI